MNVKAPNKADRGDLRDIGYMCYIAQKRQRLSRAFSQLNFLLLLFLVLFVFTTHG